MLGRLLGEPDTLRFAASGEQALQMARARPPELILAQRGFALRGRQPGAQRLREQLRGNDLASLAHAEALATSLRGQLADATWTEFQQRRDGLRFSEAEALLD
ncbi:MAG: hypothetical protein ACK4F7_08655 [Inhella sp.]